jgi:hypothetical protein
MLNTSIPSVLYLVALTYSFGLYGTAGRLNPLINIFILSVICLSIIYVGIFTKLSNLVKTKNSFTSFGYNLLTIYVFVFAVLIYDLNLGISDDPFAHSYLAFQPAIEIIKFAYINNIELDFLLRYQASFLILAGLVLGGGGVYFTSKNKYVFTFMIILCLLASRYLTLEMGGGASQHPPLRLFALMVTGSLGAASDFGFRLQGLIPLGIIIFIVYKHTKIVPQTLGIVTLPLLLHSATIVEFSIWNTAGTVLFLDRISKLSKEDIIFDAMLVTIFTLIRQPAIVLGLFLVYKLLRNKELIQIRLLLELLLIVSPALIFVLASLSGSNPAIEDSMTWEKYGNNFLESFEYFTRDFYVLYLVPIIFLVKNKHGLFLLLYFFMNLVMFMSTKTFGAPRYQLEILGGILIYSYIIMSTKYNINNLYLLLIAINISIFSNKWVDVLSNDYKYPLISEKIYPYNEALLQIGTENYSSLYIAGFDYKGMSIILNDSKTGDYLNYIDNLKKIGAYNCQEATTIKEISLILVEDRLLNTCDFNYQWKIDREITQKRSNEKIIIYTRI